MLRIVAHAALLASALALGSCGFADSRAPVPEFMRLKETAAPETEVLSRYVNMIQMARGDFNGKVLTVRDVDIRALAAVFDLSTDALTSRLDDLGLRIPAEA